MKRSLGLIALVLLFVLVLIARAVFAQTGPQGILAGAYNMYSFVPSAKLYDAPRMDGHWCSQPSYYSNIPGSDAFAAMTGGVANATASQDTDSGFAGSGTTYPTPNPSFAAYPQPDLPGPDMKGHFDGRFLGACSDQSNYDKLWDAPAGSGSLPDAGSLFSDYGITQGSIIGGCEPVSTIQNELNSVRGPSYSWLIGGTELDGYQENAYPETHMVAGSTSGTAGDMHARLAINGFYKGQTYEIINSETVGGAYAPTSGNGIGTNGDEFWTVPAAGCVTNNDYVTGPAGGWKQAHRAAFGSMQAVVGQTALSSFTAGGNNVTGIPVGTTKIAFSNGDGGGTTNSPDWPFIDGDIITLGCGGTYTSNRYPYDIRKVTATATDANNSAWTDVTLDKATDVPFATVANASGGQSPELYAGPTWGTATSCVISPGALPPYNNPQGAFALDQMKSIAINMAAAHNGALQPPYAANQFPNLHVGPADMAKSFSYQQYQLFPPYSPPYADAVFMDADCGFSVPDCTLGDGSVGPGILPQCGGNLSNIENSPQGRYCNMGVYGSTSAEIQSNTGFCGGQADGQGYNGAASGNNGAGVGFPMEAAMPYCLRGLLGMEEWADSQGINTWLILDELVQGDGGCGGGFYTDGFMTNVCSAYTSAGHYTGPVTPLPVYYLLRAFQQYNNDPNCVWNLNTTTCNFHPDGFYASFTGLPSAIPGSNIYFTENSLGRVTMWYWRGNQLTDTGDTRKTTIPATTYVGTSTKNGSGNVRGDSAHTNASCSASESNCMIDNIAPLAVTMNIQNWQQINSIKNFTIDTSQTDPTMSTFNPTGPGNINAGPNGGTSLTECPQYPYAKVKSASSSATNINGCFTTATTVTPTSAGTATTPMTIALSLTGVPQAMVFQVAPPYVGAGYQNGATPRPTAVPTIVPTATPTPTIAPTATPTPTIAPTATPTPTIAPTAGPTGLSVSPNVTSTNVPVQGVVYFTLSNPAATSYSASSGNTAFVGTSINATTGAVTIGGIASTGQNPVVVTFGDSTGATKSLSVTVGTATPSPTPTQTPSPAPTASGSGITAQYSSLQGITPPGGTNPYYPSSPLHAALPASPVPVPAATSSRWNSDQSPDNWGSITVSEDASNGNDGSDPTYYTYGDGTTLGLVCALNSAGSVGKYYCDNTLTNFENSIMEFWNNAANCPDSNYGGTNYGCPVTINQTVPAGAITAGDSDHHIILIKTTETYASIKGYEIDGWGDGSLSTRTAPGSGSWTFAALGACNLAGDGTACGSAFATNMAGSLGLVRAEDILYCLNGAGASNANCVLPTALAVAPKCNGTNFEYPASASDGQCGGGGTTGNTGGDSARVPEGARGFLNETDAQINALAIADFQKIIYRTMDKQHFGFFIRDTNYSGGPGIVFQYQGGEAYAAMGKTDPWLTLYNFETNEGNSSYVSSGNSGKDMIFNFGQSASNVLWCADSHTDGLCD